MQNERSGARTHHKKSPKAEEVLSPGDAAAAQRGQALKRYVRAAAALNSLYEDTEIAEAVGVSRGAVSGWWRGAQPSVDTIYRLADATGLSPDELTRFVYQWRSGPGHSGPRAPARPRRHAAGSGSPSR